MMRLRPTHVMHLWVATAICSPIASARSKIESDRKPPTLEDQVQYFRDPTEQANAEQGRRAQELRLQTIDSISTLLKSKTSDANRRFELMLRLGELYVESHDYQRDQEVAQFSQAYDSWSKTDKKGREPKLNDAKSKALLVEAVNTYRKIATDFPKHPRSDTVLYELGKTLARLDNASAVLYLNQLITKHPKSPLVPEAHLAIGEFYFDHHDIPRASEAYRQVMKFKDHRVYPYAIYKLGWCHYNGPVRNDEDERQNLTKAVAAFKLVIKLDDSDKSSGQKRVSLREEALKDLVMVWSDAGDVESAWEYFRTVGAEGRFYDMLERLGWLYVDQGKRGPAISVYQRLLKEAPNRPRNPTIHGRLVGLYDDESQPAQVVAELDKMRALYLADGSWTKAQPPKSTDIAEASKTVESQHHRLGTLYHTRAQKTKNADLYRTAKAIYTGYLGAFPKTPQAYDVRFFLADVLFDLKEYSAAADHYLAVAKADTQGGKHLRESALNAVLALNKLMDSERFADLPPPGQVKAPLEIPATKKRLVDAADLFLKVLPSDPEGEQMRLASAEVFYAYGHYDEATKRFRSVIELTPKTKQAKKAALLGLNLYITRQDWAGVVSWSRYVLQQKEVATPDIRNEFQANLRRALFELALAQERAGDHAASAASFSAFQKEFPNDPSADRAAYNAMLNYYKAGRVPDGVIMARIVLDQYPKSTVRPTVAASLAETHEALGEFDAAKDAYMRFARDYPRDDKADRALYNAAVLARGLGALDEAQRAFAKLASSARDSAIRRDALFEQAEVEEAMNSRSARSTYGLAARELQKSDRDRAFLAAAKSAVLQAQEGGSDETVRDLGRTLAREKGLEARDARRVVAAALFDRSEKKYADFMNQGITDGAKFEQQVRSKQSRLESLARTYEEIMGVGNPEFAVASLYRLGTSHEEFATALFKAPPPPGSNQAAVNEFRTIVEKLAFPLKEEASKFYEAAVNQAKEIGTFSPWTIRAYEKMTEANPERYPQLDERTTTPRYVTHHLEWDQDVARLAD